MRAGLTGFGVRGSGFGVLRSVVLRSLVLGSVVLVLGSMVLGSTAHAADDTPKVDELLERVATRIAEFYRRAENVICIEKSVVQHLGIDQSLDGMARVVESELHVESDEADGGEAKVVREIKTINGRPPRQRDKKDRAACMDPEPLSIEPLSFLLPAHRAEYVFTVAGTKKDRDREMLLIDFATKERNTKLELIEDPGGHDDCYGWEGSVARSGRIWVDPTTYDVSRVDEQFKGRVDVKVPYKLQRRSRLEQYVVIERYNTTKRYKVVSFQDPSETLLLPESIDELMLVHGGLSSTRRSQRFSNYRRFLTGGRVVK